MKYKPQISGGWLGLSQGTSVQEVLRDLYQHFLGRRQVDGAPSSEGVTTQPRPAENADQVVDAMTTGWGDELRAKKGGSAFENANTGPDAYNERRYQFLTKEEAIRHQAYDDATGKPFDGADKKGNITVGIGFNMERRDAREVFQKVLGLDDNKFNEVYNGKRKLNDEQVRSLFEYTADEAEQIVRSRIGRDHPLKEHELLALTSLAFNGPSLIGPRLTAAVKTRDTNAALHEILFNSNRKKIRGLANRRYREGRLFAGPANTEVAMPSLADYLQMPYG